MPTYCAREPVPQPRARPASGLSTRTALEATHTGHRLAPANNSLQLTGPAAEKWSVQRRMRLARQLSSRPLGRLVSCRPFLCLDSLTLARRRGLGEASRASGGLGAAAGGVVRACL